MQTSFHYERDEDQYRLYFENVFLGWFNSLEEVNHEIKLRKEHAQSDPYVKHRKNLVDSGQFVRVQ